MNINSVKFIKGMGSANETLQDTIPQVAFIGRSNVGKSSTINTLTKQKDLAKTSSFPGRTQQLNVFLINTNLYLVDLPGYGFAKLSLDSRSKLFELINAYLFNSHHKQKKVVLIIDALVGPTDDDLDMIEALEKHKKDIVIVANKIDKIKKADYKKQLEKIQDKIGPHTIVPFSAEKKIGVGELANIILN